MYVQYGLDLARPEDRRASEEYVEKFKQTSDDKHILHEIEQPQQTIRLKSRRRFISFSIEPLDIYPLHQLPL